MVKFNEFRYELLLYPAYLPDLTPCDYFQTWRNDWEEKDSPPESSSSLKRRLILKRWTNHIIRMTWKSWRIVGSSVSSWKETILRNKNESIKKNMFYYIFLKTYWLALVFYYWRDSDCSYCSRCSYFWKHFHTKTLCDIKKIEKKSPKTSKNSNLENNNIFEFPSFSKKIQRLLNS